MKPSEFIANLSKEIETKADLRRIFNKEVLESIGKVATDGMKELIAIGASPIAGKGTFSAYKKPLKYPGKRKAHNPVNLKLTGQMLNSLRYRINQAKVIVTIFYANNEASKKEQGHREGARGQPRRPTIPIKQESFHPSITKAIQDLVNRVLKKAQATFK